jgi:hypothetical protein
MSEIWIPEAIVAVFLALFLARPLVKVLWPLDGLAWLPLLALGITIGLFPAYGFRPECIPLLLFELVLNVVHFRRLVFGGGARPGDDFRDGNPLLAVPALAALAAALLLVFVFSPRLPPGLTTEGVQFVKIRDEPRELRIYGPVQGESAPGVRPLILLIPPEAGSIPAVDLVCAGLRDRGFTVISYSRKGFDFPALVDNRRLSLPSPALINAMWRAFRAGTTFKTANDQGRALEIERMGDIEWLLPRVRALAGAAENAPLFLVGYGAGGGALVLFSENPGFDQRFGGVLGMVAVESRLWSAWRPEPPLAAEISAGAPWNQRIWGSVSNWFGGLKPRRLSGIGALPRPGLPLLCLVSDQAASPGTGGRAGENPYQALIATLRNSPHPAALAAISGAGPLDYTGYPLSHPLYSFLFPGRETSAPGGGPLTGTVNIISNFIVELLEQNAADSSIQIPARHSVNTARYLETWNSGK